MDLSNLSPADGATKTRKRKGRGPGSGNGKTAGRGHKGQKSRSGGGVPIGFEGGQMPLHRRLPKRGFFNRFRKEWSIVNLADLERVFDDGDTVDTDTLVSKGLIWSRMNRLSQKRDEESGDRPDKVRMTRPVKILGRGELTKKLTVKAAQFSKSAEQAIVSAGGSVEVI